MMRGEGIAELAMQVLNVITHMSMNMVEGSRYQSQGFYYRSIE